MTLPRHPGVSCLVAVLAACGGDEFSSQTMERDSSGAGGVEAGSGGVAGLPGGASGWPTSGGTGAGPAMGGFAGGGTAGNAAEAGTSGQGGEPIPACQGTAFTVEPPHPKQGEPFTLALDATNLGGVVCVHAVFECEGQGIATLPDLLCDSTSCTWEGTIGPCGPGPAHAELYTHHRSSDDVCCDGDPNTTCAVNNDIPVSDPGELEAECKFEVGP